MKRIEFAKTMGVFHRKLIETFGDNNVRVAQTTSLDPWHNRLFLIRTTDITHEHVTTDTALVIRVHLRDDTHGIWAVTSFYNYPYLSLDKERDITSNAGDILESLLHGGMVICETGDVKVNIANMKPLSDIFGQRISHTA